MYYKTQDTLEILHKAPGNFDSVSLGPDWPNLLTTIVLYMLSATKMGCQGNEVKKETTFLAGNFNKCLSYTVVEL